MPAFLAAVFSKAGLYAALAAAALAALLYVGHLRSSLKSVTAQVSVLQADNQQESVTITSMQEKVKRYDAIEANTETGVGTIAATNEKEHVDLATQPAGSLSPVLVGVLNNIRATP